LIERDNLKGGREEDQTDPKKCETAKCSVNKAENPVNNARCKQGGTPSKKQGGLKQGGR
jgi:hypothetical protein